METAIETKVDWKQLAHQLGNRFAERADQYDKNNSFVFENYHDLKLHRFFSAAVPQEFGGGGVPHSEICDLIRIIGNYCGSTALALSMHQHLLAAAIWRYRNKGESAPLLQKVSNEQWVLVSTGANDWLESNGEMVKHQDGYLVSGKKHFASQSVAGDVAITSARYMDPENGWQVLHFPVPLKSKGVSLQEDWDTMGMRATGSQTIVFDNVFVPSSAIVLTRPADKFHPVWDVVLTVAMPLIMSAYVGVAEKAMAVALEAAKKRKDASQMPYVIGKMNNLMVAARTQLKAMIALADDINFKPDHAVTMEILSLKTNVVEACMQLVHEGMECVGGQSFYKRNMMERLFRDMQGAQFHPLPKWNQYLFTGERLLGIK